MCGIFCEIICSASKLSQDENILRRIKNRGPDCFHSTQFISKNNYTLMFYASVLWMQGLEVTKQPVENDKGILLFNGDIFDETWDKSRSDTHIVMNKLTESLSSENIVTEIKKFRGPFSLIYFDKCSENVYFTRDCIGRNTLLCSKWNDSVLISSVLSRKYPCVEVPASYLYKYDLKSNSISLYDWQETLHDSVSVYSFNDWIDTVQKQQDLPDDEFILDHSLEDPINEEDDLIQHIEKLSQEYSSDKCISTLFRKLLEHNKILSTVIKLTRLLEDSIKIRLETQPAKCKNCINTSSVCVHSATGLLFSGGLDCTLLALLADRYVPKNQSIDLLNVAFAKRTKHTLYDVPDRITGYKSFEELKRICKTRQWIFREINVPIEKIEEYQSNVIADLIYPRHTVLDESLGTALWFGASGLDENDASPSRVLLIGSGADELFGGYIRHRNALKRQGWSGLRHELLLDWKRISFRNLARDNRVICDHGRQPRMPYLDENLVNYVVKLQPWLRCFPTERLEIGVGDKLMLRVTAFYNGLTEAATFPKRALQFGSRIANSKQKGSDISKNFIVQ